MPVDSNKPLQRVSVQSNHNDTIWNGAAWGAGAGIGAAGLTYGATMHGARGLSNLNYKVAGNKTVREMTRADKLKEKGKPFMSSAGIDAIHEHRMDKADAFSNKMGKVQKAGNFMFGEGPHGSLKRSMVAGAAGLLGGMVTGALIDSKK